ncbi:MAG: ABC transporter ATP-binding protein [Pseudonocardiaceae bacterium]
MSAHVLPIADEATSLGEARFLLRQHRRQVSVLLALHAAAVLAGLVAPWLLGTLVNSVVASTSAERIDTLAVIIALSVVLQTGLVWAANRESFVFGENVFSDLRETFAGRLLTLPLTTVERAGSGDIVSRTTRDVDAVSDFVRTGLPEVMVGVLSVVFTLAAAFLVNAKLALVCLVGLPIIVMSTRWFTRRAKDAFAAELAASAALNTTVIETVHGARSVEALNLGATRKRAISSAIRTARVAETVPLRLRTVWFPLVQAGYQLPLIAVLLIGGRLVTQGQANIGQVATVALYVRLLVVPLNDLIYWYGELQLGLAAFARIVGVGQVAPDRTATTTAPQGRQVQVDQVRYAYRANHDVLKSVSVDIRLGERLAVVGPSGAGKSTLGLLLAGVFVPNAGRVTLGSVDLKDIPVDQLRGHVALVTQEDYVFAGSVADNLRLGHGRRTHGSDGHREG